MTSERVRPALFLRALLGLALLGLLLSACVTDSASRITTSDVGVRGYHRAPGMPIGTGAAGGQLEEPDDLPIVSAADLTNNADLTIPRFAGPAALASEAPVPCSGCLELNVDVSDINQRDEFVIAVEGATVTRVVWTLLVNFNSDQLAVQPFIDDTYGEYTNLHVNHFPLATPVQLEQRYRGGKAQVIGLVVGSSGAWTGNQTMSVFVDSLTVEGDPASVRSFAHGAEGLAPRTRAHRPHVVHHPEGGAAPVPVAPPPRAPASEPGTG